MQSPANHIILFDGICNFCNNITNFLIRQDKKKVFRFAALQSQAGQQLLEAFALPPTGINSFIFISENKVYTNSSAALKVCNLLPWYWKWAQVFWIIPRFIRDGIYAFVAKNRYRIFGKRNDCVVPTPEIRHRFL